MVGNKLAKKMLFVFTLSLLFVSHVYAAGIVEYNGRNYLYGAVGGVAVEYASRQDVSEYPLDSAIYGNHLLLIVFIAPRNVEATLARGYIQNGDEFLLDANRPDVFAVYNGPRRNVANSFISSEGNCWGIGYAVHGGRIFITELILNRAEHEELERNMEVVSQ